MDLLSVKIIALIAIAAIAVAGGAIPLFSSKLKNSERFFSLGNAFAGGLFLGVGFIHLLPEGIEQLAPYTHFPLGVMAATIGFTVLLLLDRILFPSEQFVHQKELYTEPIYPYVLLSMLSLHSIVAGVALGIENHVSGALAMMLGIIFHKGPAAFALIVSAHAAGIERNKQTSILALFSIMTPVGIIIGFTTSFIIVPETKYYSMILGSFNAFAAGTFIYIAVLDIIDKELSSHQKQMNKYVNESVASQDYDLISMPYDDRYWKFLLIVAGIVFIALVSAWFHA